MIISSGFSLSSLDAMESLNFKRAQGEFNGKFQLFLQIGIETFLE